ncbi:hypothetical protein HK096_009031 [Nowakowskiella sp. JEL0078]|nr:hypothetical protein HK096_009031 [Nowakowskiella sp. JEL0078]
MTTQQFLTALFTIIAFMNKKLKNHNLALSYECASVSPANLLQIRKEIAERKRYQFYVSKKKRSETARSSLCQSSSSTQQFDSSHLNSDTSVIESHSATFKSNESEILDEIAILKKLEELQTEKKKLFDLILNQQKLMYTTNIQLVFLTEQPILNTKSKESITSPEKHSIESSYTTNLNLNTHGSNFQRRGRSPKSPDYSRKHIRQGMENSGIQTGNGNNGLRPGPNMRINKYRRED